jgi:hypothetical protein
MQTEPIDQQNAMALEMEIWRQVGELTKPLYGHQPIPVLMALRIVASHYLEIMKDPQDTLRRLVVDLNAALDASLERTPFGRFAIFRVVDGAFADSRG